MKIQVNMTTSPEDMVRYTSRQEILDQIRGFDGLELMWFGDNDMVTPDMVTGVHLNCRQTWYDFWIGNEEALVAEFDDLATVERVYGSLDPHILVDKLKDNMAVAHRYGAEYVVFHVSESNIPESLAFKFAHTDEEIIDAACDILNEVFADEDGSIALMMENLWYPGLSLTDPAMTRRLLDQVRYGNKGLMFDTGHLLHTNFDLRSQEEGLAYINRRLDEHEAAGLLDAFRGMHLQQSITGAYCKELAANPPELGATYADRSWQLFPIIFEIDQHRPFTCPGVREMIDRLPLEYLTFEFITDDAEQHTSFLAAQRAAIGLPE